MPVEYCGTVWSIHFTARPDPALEEKLYRKIRQFLDNEAKFPKLPLGVRLSVRVKKSLRKDDGRTAR